jgi:hypothetical protein
MYAVLPADSVNPAVTFDGIIAIGGKVYTEISSAGGPAITLATSGAGVVTSFAGSVYTVATSAAGTAATGTGYASKTADCLKANNIFFSLGTRLWGIFVRYTSQPLCSPHSLQRLAACYSALGWLFKRCFGVSLSVTVIYANFSHTFIGL